MLHTVRHSSTTMHERDSIVAYNFRFRVMFWNFASKKSSAVLQKQACISLPRQSADARRPLFSHRIKGSIKLREKKGCEQSTRKKLKRTLQSTSYKLSWRVNSKNFSRGFQGADWGKRHEASSDFARSRHDETLHELWQKSFFWLWS